MNIADEILNNPEAFWSNRYKTNETGWDIGSVSGPIKSILDGLSDKNIRILIPGAGNAWEAEYAWKLGFKDVYVLFSDICSAVQPDSWIKGLKM